ncbi:MAG: hypothetical protein SXQ77_04535, partial [Halobacteria archaeon]|nr:hypothetical protein [Halobacteria archaeon]
MTFDKEGAADKSIDRRSVLRSIAVGSVMGAGLTTATGTAVGHNGVSHERSCNREVTAHTPDGNVGDSSRTVHEPMLNVDSDGNIFLSVVEEPVGILRSTDDGETWNNMTMPQEEVWDRRDKIFNTEQGSLYERTKEYYRTGTSFSHIDE